MNRDNHFGTRRDQSLELGFIQVKGIRSNVNEDRLGASQDKGVHGRDKSEVGDDHFIAGLNIQKNRRHIQCVRA